MLGACDGISDIEMYSCNWDGNTIANVHFPRLKQAKFYSNHSLNDTNFNRFIAFCPILEKLTLYWNPGLTSKSSCLICKHLSQLIELDVNEPSIYIRSNVDTFGQLTKLESLTIRYRNHSIDYSPHLMEVLANGNVPIELVNIDIINQLEIEYLAKLKTMKMFTLECTVGLMDDNMLELAMGWPQIETINVIGLKNLVKHTKKLKYLKLEGSTHLCTVNFDDYAEMVKMVQNRPERIQLSIVCKCFDHRVFRVPNSISSKYQEWLLIDEK